MQYIRFFTCFILVFVFISCMKQVPVVDIEVSENANPWTHLKWNNDADNIQFAVVGDRTGGHVPGIFKQAVDKLNLLQPEFVLSVGDLIEGKRNITEPEQIKVMWNEYDSIVKTLSMPFFYVAGNHDLNNKEMVKQWKERLGRYYYHFIYRDVLFLCLCTEELHYTGAGGITISDEQVEYFRTVLLKHTNARWTFLFMHKPAWKPVYTGKPVKNWEIIESMLKDRNYTVFAGHKHRYNKTIRNGMIYYGMSATGVSSGNNKEDECKFQHVVWVTMTDEGPIVANLMLDGILDDTPCSQ